MKQGDDLESTLARFSFCSQPTTKKAFHAPNPSDRSGIAHDVVSTVSKINRSWGIRPKKTVKSQEQQEKAQMEHASNYEEWRQAAEKLDILSGRIHWKFDEESEDCDMALLRRRLDILKEANRNNDIEEMVHLIRTSLKRDLGGMCHVHLYQHCNVGTKNLIEEYTDVVKFTIEKICKHCATLDPETNGRYLGMMQRARHSFGKSALMLSGGGTLGMCHIGVVKTLLLENLLPRVVCGSSAGSIVSAVLCTQKGSAILEKLDELINGDLNVFQGPDEIQGVPGMANNILRGQPAFNINNLSRVMKNLLGDVTFREAYNMTGMTLNIHVSTRDKHHLPRLLNYITSPNIVVWSAVASSCALPFVFEPPGLWQKNPNSQKLEPIYGDHKWIDGSIEGDLPSQIMERLFNVNNFIASQVNPHVAAFLPNEGETPNWIRKALLMARANTVFALDGIMDHGYDTFAIKAAHAVLSQKYDGNVTILPDIAWVGVTKILANPTHEFMQHATKVGEKATWPKIGRIKTSVDIELALDRGIKDIQAIRVGANSRRVRAQKKGRTASATRSEQGLAVRRSRSNGAEGAALLNLSPLLPRGRANGSSHRVVKSMVEPFNTGQAGTVASLKVSEQILSSSDETHSGRSSPNTSSYEDEEQLQEYEDESDSDDEARRQEEEDQRLRMFLSQPTSPSISKKAFWGMDSSAGPSSPEAKRTWGSLQMSKAQRDLELERKRRRNDSNA